jgi:hypothetical protein
MKKLVFMVATHGFALAIGFALGVYLLPIITAPDGPAAADLSSIATQAKFSGRFRRDLKGSDLLHWGEGVVSVGPRAVALAGKVSPGPDYKLYLAPQFVEDEAAFLRVKAKAVRLGDVKTFDNFIVPVPGSVDVEAYDTVVVWCETFSQFISAAKYR